MSELSDEELQAKVSSNVEEAARCLDVLTQQYVFLSKIGRQYGHAVKRQDGVAETLIRNQHHELIDAILDQRMHLQTLMRQEEFLMLEIMRRR